MYFQSVPQCSITEEHWVRGGLRPVFYTDIIIPSSVFGVAAAFDQLPVRDCLFTDVEGSMSIEAIDHLPTTVTVIQGEARARVSHESAVNGVFIKRPKIRIEGLDIDLTYSFYEAADARAFMWHYAQLLKWLEVGATRARPGSSFEAAMARARNGIMHALCGNTTVRIPIKCGRSGNIVEVIYRRTSTLAHCDDLGLLFGVHQNRPSITHSTSGRTVGQYIGSFGFPLFFVVGESHDYMRTSKYAHSLYGNTTQAQPVPAGTPTAPQTPAPPSQTQPKLNSVPRSEMRTGRFAKQGHKMGAPDPRRSKSKALSKGVQPAIEAIAESVMDEVDKLAGASDAAAEQAAEEAAEALDARRVSVGTNALHSMPREVAFHCIGVETPALIPMLAPPADVARDLNGLRLSVMPRTAAHATINSVVNCAQLAQGEKPELTPHARDMHIPKGDYHVALYDVRLFRGTFPANLCWIPDAQQPWQHVSICVEQFLFAQSRRIVANCTFETALDRVQSFRASWTSYGVNMYDPGLNSHMCDLVFTALLLQDTMYYSRIDLVDYFAKHTVREVQNRILSDPHRPLVSGMYTKGYAFGPKQLLGDSMTTMAMDIKAMDPLARAEAARAAAVKWVTEHCNTAAALKYLKPRDRAVDDKDHFTARQMPISVAGLTPSFPDPKEKPSCLFSFIKRLLPKRDPDAASVARADAVAVQIIETCKTAEVTALPEEQVKLYLRCAGIKKFGDQTHELASYMLGVEDFLDCDEVELLARIKTERLGVFIKAEDYPVADLKAARFIASPAPYLRGVYAAACFYPEDVFKQMYAQHLVKGLTPQQTTAKIMSSFAGHTCVVESDYSTFESTIETHALEREARFYAAITTPGLRGKTGAVFQYFVDNYTEFRGAGLSGVYPHIRQSGTAQTSIGNAFNNLCLSFGSLAKAMGIPTDRVAAWFKEWSFPYYVEGDDGLFAIPSVDVLPGWVEAHEEGGASIKLERKWSWAECEFCGNRLVDTVKKGFVRYKDPVQTLISLTTWLNPDRTTGQRDLEIQVAKAMSYLCVVPDLPLVAPFAKALVARFSFTRARIEADLIDHNTGPKFVGANYLRESYAKHRGMVQSSAGGPITQEGQDELILLDLKSNLPEYRQEDPDAGPTIMERLKRLWWVWGDKSNAIGSQTYSSKLAEAWKGVCRDAALRKQKAREWSSDVTVEMRTAFQTQWGEFTAQVQESIEEQLVSAVLNADGPLYVEIPLLRNIKERYDETVHTTSRYFLGRREAAEKVIADLQLRQRADALTSAFGLIGGVITSRVSLICSAFTSMFTLVGLLLAGFSMYWYWTLYPLYLIPLLFLAALVGRAAAWFFFGVPWHVTGYGLNVLSWSFAAWFFWPLVRFGEWRALRIRGYDALPADPGLAGRVQIRAEQHLVDHGAPVPHGPRKPSPPSQGPSPAQKAGRVASAALGFLF